MAVLVAPASFVVRLVYPYGSEAGFTDLSLWEWPACIVVFVLGIGAVRHGWIETIPGHLARRFRSITLLGAITMVLLLTIVGLLDAIDDALGGWNWAAAAFTPVETVLTVFGSVWLLSVAQHRLGRSYRWGPVLSRSAYGAFILQTLFLLGLALALRSVEVPAEVKAVVLAVGGVTASFAVAWLLISRVPGVSRVL